MRGHKAFISMLHAFVLLLFAATGLVFLCLPFMPDARYQLSGLFIHRSERLIPIGIGLFGFTLLLGLAFYGVNRGRFLRLKMGGQPVEIDQKVIKQCLQECFQTHFKDQMVLLDVQVLRRLEIDVKMVSVDEGEREMLFLKAEVALQALLKERFGYTRPFVLTARL